MRALVVEDDPRSRTAIAALVADEGFEVATAHSLAQARLELQAARTDLVLCDLVLPDGQGTELLRELQGEPATEVVLVTGHASVESAIEALRLGAHDYLPKPVDTRRLVAILRGFRRTAELKRDVSDLRRELRELGHFGPLLGSSPAMQRVYALVERGAPTDASVLVVGESGSGKELVARAVHRLSRRRDAPLVAVNAGAITASLVESELFGHERGSFTGAARQHPGYFERAHGGTLFLDEITEMPFELQVKLLRVLETREVVRVGGVQPFGVDVRLIAATNRPLQQALAEGRLREDLFYRLNVFPIELPPLRERTGDVSLLAEHFLAELNRVHDTGKRLTPAALRALEAYGWPGNVRELRHVIERAYILADEVIEPDTLALRGEGGVNGVATNGGGPMLHVRVGSPIREAERRLVLATLDHHGGDKKATAGSLGVSLKTLYNRLEEYRRHSEGR